MPVIVLPQFLLCGLLVPRDAMPDWLHAISNVLPLTYAVEALQEVGRSAAETGTMWRDVGIVAGCVLLALALAAGTRRRSTTGARRSPARSGRPGGAPAIPTPARRSWPPPAPPSPSVASMARRS